MIYLASDHGGYDLKQKIKNYLEAKRLKFTDFGPKRFVQEDDYPDFVIPMAEAVAKDKNSLGIAICRSAGGAIISANKVKGIRAVAAFDLKMAIYARARNDANVVGLSADLVDELNNIKIVESFLATRFSHYERDKRRLNEIRHYEES